MEPQESSQADEGEQEAPGLPEVRYTGFQGTPGLPEVRYAGFRGTQGCYENWVGKWIKRKNAAKLITKMLGLRTVWTDPFSSVKQRFEKFCLEEMREELEKMANDPDALQELMTPKNNAVEHPSHYTSGGIECIDAMKAMLAGYEQAKIATKFYWHFLSGQVLKYLWRWPLKERPLQDLKKARWYLDRLIDDIEKQDEHFVRKETME